MAQTQEEQSREIVEQADRLIRETEESGKRLRERLAQCDVQPEEYLRAYNTLRPGTLEKSAEFAKEWVEEEFPMAKPKPAAVPSKPMRRNLV